jgi:type III secretory pathway component EscV
VVRGGHSPCWAAEPEIIIIIITIITIIIIIPVITGATGVVMRSLRKNLEAVPGKH